MPVHILINDFRKTFLKIPCLQHVEDSEMLKSKKSPKERREFRSQDAKR